MYQPWSQVIVVHEHKDVIFLDKDDLTEIVRLPVYRMPKDAHKDLYESVRREYLKGYTQGVDDKRNEIRAILGCY